MPPSVALSDGGLSGAISELTRHRRSSHLGAEADAYGPLVFNDYMNALMGDPTTEKLIPLIDAAAEVGAGYFCIDAGWYEDGGDWSPSVGAWEPSTVRFGELGLVGVLDRIRAKGMSPGLWVEPEVVGVRSPVAHQLPEEAFMHRGGARIVEHNRYFLGFRSQAACDHLDGVFERLIVTYGATCFKWDYNVTPGTGPDTDASSPSAGLLRLYLSGHLDKLDEGQLALVRAAASLYSKVMDHHARALPQWPIGLPGWDAGQVALATVDDDSAVVFVWNRDPAAGELEFALPDLADADVDVTTLLLVSLPQWPRPVGAPIARR